LAKLAPDDVESLCNELSRLRSCLVLMKRAMTLEVEEKSDLLRRIDELKTNNEDLQTKNVDLISLNEDLHQKLNRNSDDSKCKLSE
jgi:hypothetical protein